MLDTVLQIRVNRNDRKLVKKLARRWKMNPSEVARNLLMQEVTRVIATDIESPAYIQPIRNSQVITK